MPTRSFKAIYDNHRGPYSLHFIKEIDVRGKPAEGSDHVDGPFSAEEAHEESRLLLRQRPEIVEIFVYSIRENQYIGAFYKRGLEFLPWHAEEEKLVQGGLGLRSEPEPAALVFKETSVGTTIVDGVDRVSEDHPRARPAAEPKARAARVPKVPREQPAASKLPGDRFPAVRGRALELDLGNAERWPGSQPAQLVREFFAEGKRATAAEVVQALGARLKEMGMEHPASLVSRLKQAGFLKETEA